MLPFATERSVFQNAHCFFSYGTMGHIDPTQPPMIEHSASAEDTATATATATTVSRLKKPWASLQALRFVRQLDLVLPQAWAAPVQQALAAGPVASPQYARVVMTLGQVLEGDMFMTYVKGGNVLMLSRGRPGQDNVFALCGGHLTLFLERETYERAGLVGRPQGPKGNRGLQPRWVVELDLNAKAMWPGKKGFSRLLYACKNVLHEPVPWMFCNLFETPGPDPLSAFAPTFVTATPTVLSQSSLQVPPLDVPACLSAVGDEALADRVPVDDTDDLVELYEWLSLVRLGSPRLAHSDAIDPYLCRYQVPVRRNSLANIDDEPAPPIDDVCTLRWQGFLAPSWVCRVLMAVLTTVPASATADTPWFSLSAASFASSQGLSSGEGAQCTLFRPANAPGRYLLWEVRSHA